MSESGRATIPIFPLTAVVLFPKVRVPLYIFEPRYRQMTQHALAGDGRIGMVTVRPEHFHQTAGNPAVFSTGCEGEIIHSEALPDGGYNIVLQGTQRFQIRSESSPQDDRLYRIAEVALLSEARAEGPQSREQAQNPELRLSDARSIIGELLRELVGEPASGLRGPKSENDLFEHYDDEFFVNSLAQSLNFSAPEKQALLECGGVPERLQHLVALLQFRLAAIRSGQSGVAPLQ